MDVIISNCVINLSVDKASVLREAFRVLRPGGRFAVSDIVLRGDLPEGIQKSLEMWAGCVAGALQESEYRQLLAEAGFEDIDIEPTRVYTADDSREFLGEAGIDGSGSPGGRGADHGRVRPGPKARVARGWPSGHAPEILALGLLETTPPSPSCGARANVIAATTPLRHTPVVPVSSRRPRPWSCHRSPARLQAMHRTRRTSCCAVDAW